VLLVWAQACISSNVKQASIQSEKGLILLMLLVSNFIGMQKLFYVTRVFNNKQKSRLN
jgi:hypothetical protein